MTRWMPIIVALYALRMPSAAQSGIEGAWEGEIAIPGSPLEVKVRLAREGERWSGEIDIPAQNAAGLPLDPVTVDGTKTVFSIKGVPGKPTFKGEVASDGLAITGKFTQGFGKFDFRLGRAGVRTAAFAATIEEFPKWLEATRSAWKVPGISVALVRGAEVVFVGGAGAIDPEGSRAVDADTLFAIGSATKAFTATLLATLADEGRLEFDTPVRTWMPDFELMDALATRAMTPRDLLTHRSGLPRHDLAWYGSKATRAELFASLRYLAPNKGFRETFQYQNLMFMAAGHLAERVTGKPYEELLAERLFSPLGMVRSHCSIPEMEKDANAARPCAVRDGKTLKLGYRDLAAIGPAGSINSSARDLAAWLRFQLGDGTANGKRLLEASTLEHLREPQLPIHGKGGDPEVGATSYAHGWMVDRYRERLRVHHGGAIDGFLAAVAFLPAERVGVAVLCNRDGSALPEVVVRTAIDRMLDLETIDWSTRKLAEAKAAETAGKAGAARAELVRKTGTRPAHATEDYAGRYEHPAYGRIDITANPDGTLAASFHDLPLVLEHWHYETFRARSDDPALAEARIVMTFQADHRGEIVRLVSPLEPLAPDIVFAKRPPSRLLDPAFLAGLAGRYTMKDGPPVAVTIELRADAKLVLRVPNQPAYELVPRQRLDFDFRDLNGYAASFELDADGRASRLVIIQPEGVFVAERE